MTPGICECVFVCMSEDIIILLQNWDGRTLYSSRKFITHFLTLFMEWLAHLLKPAPCAGFGLLSIIQSAAWHISWRSVASSRSMLSIIFVANSIEASLRTTFVPLETVAANSRAEEAVRKAPYENMTHNHHKKCRLSCIVLTHASDACCFV